ncbi:ankyrin repeat domain-containing protein [Streptomyces sp. NPDC047130]
MNNRQRKKLPLRLAAAAADGKTGTVKHLLAKGADPNAPSPDGATPLYLASVQGETRCAELLLAAGASPAQESTGWRRGLPLVAAVVKADRPLVELLLRYGADPRLPETNGGSALDWADGWDDDEEDRPAIAALLQAHLA